MAFDLDDEELKATRMMNGVDRKGRVNKMEQDIKKLQEIINLCNEELDNKDENVTAVLDLTDLLSLRNLIKAYKELEEWNEYYRKEMLSKEYIKLNYIPKSKVEEKIEELNRKIKYEDNEKVIIWLHKQRKILQELLEKRK